MSDTAEHREPEGSNQVRDPRQDAGRDPSIEKRLKRDPYDPDAKVDAGSDESMDASDPPSAAAPGSQDPVPSSGYDEEAERAR